VQLANALREKTAHKNLQVDEDRVARLPIIQYITAVGHKFSHPI